MKLLFVDLDGTIRCSTTGNLIESPKGQKPILGADQAIRHFESRDWEIIGISNQASIAGGYKSLESTVKEMEYTLWLFPGISEILFCPDFEGRRCVVVSRFGLFKMSFDEEPGYRHIAVNPKFAPLNFRKPGNAMLQVAIEKCTRLPIDVFIVASKMKPGFECWMVGSRKEDEEAAESLSINYLDAEPWRRRFLPGMHEFNLTLEQARFLEYK